MTSHDLFYGCLMGYAVMYVVYVWVTKRWI
jgi:hypothetical protein